MPKRGQEPFAAIVEAVKELRTASFTRIARRAGVSVPAVHYYLTKKFPRLGILVRVVPNLRRLGLSEYLVELDFGGRGNVAVPVLRFLGSYNYLSYYARRIPDARMLTIWAVPEGAANEFFGLLDGLREDGLLRDYAVRPLAWRKTLSLNPSFFDPDKGEWRVDWGEVLKSTAPLELPPDREPVVDFDRVDLLILKELQRNAFAKKAQIARAIGVSDKTVQFHWLHIEARKLIEDIAVGVFYANVDEYAYLFLLCEGGDSERNLRFLAKIPFTWRVWMLDGGEALAALFVPNSELSKTLAFAAENLSGCKDVKAWFVDARVSDAFAVPFKMFDGSCWTFEKEATLAYLLEYLKKLGKLERA